MSWSPTDEELKAENAIKYIPPLLNSFLKTRFHGQANVKEESHRISQRINSIAQDIVYCVSKGRSRTPKSVLFPCVVKSLCNKLEVIKIINPFGHGINYNLIREIETEHALMVINQQVDKRVVIPDEENLKLEDNKIALMVADNIDNLESTITGLGTSHRVNSILVTKGIKSEHGEVTSEEAPTKKKCSRSLPSDQVMKDVPDYYHGKRIGPGELKYLTNLDESDVISMKNIASSKK